MTPEEVQALVGPPYSQAWLYRKPNEVIEVSFGERGASKFHRSHRDASKTTIQGWSPDSPPYWREFDNDPKHRVTQIMDTAPRAEMPVLKGDPPAKVVKLFGPPEIMYVEYSPDPLRGRFENGKLTSWFTTPRPPPVEVKI